MLGAVGLSFAIYSKYGGEYANSVRWTRSAGYLDMIRTLINSRKTLPGSAKVMVATFYTFVGWSTVVPSNGNIVETMARALTGPIAIENATALQTYTPVTADYKLACSTYGVSFEFTGLIGGDCGRMNMWFERDGKIDSPPKTQRSPNRWNLTATSTQQNYALLAMPLRVQFNSIPEALYGQLEDVDYTCILQESLRVRPRGALEEGITSYPTTLTTKCFPGSRAIRKLRLTTVLSLTSVRFRMDNKNNTDNTVAGEIFDMNIIKEYFGEVDEMFSTMAESIKNINIPDSPNTTGQSNMWVEFRTANSSVDLLACVVTEKFTSSKYLGWECIYASIYVLVIKDLENQDISQALGSNTFDQEIRSNYMTIEHAPRTTNGNGYPVSLAKIRSDTAAVADYMARLGSNFYADFRNGKLYIQYDVSEIKLGLEAPLWVLILTAALAVVGLLVWQLTDLLVGYPYTSSLYKTIETQLASASKTNTPSPRLMKCNLKPLTPLTLDGVQLVPDDNSPKV
ncbi:hypothetical protein BGX27_000922 [Mortierella sp. AM989]|nr:hypothetical protein BGX27_000922 [Mortierella sp. AM989]